VYDLVVKNALICDGSGTPARPGAVAVADGRIVAVDGDVGPARETVDAGGLVLAPGIIDSHTHYDAQITWDPMVDPSPALGVTSVVIGCCGFTIAPCKPGDRDRTLRNLTHVEGMSLDALRAGVRWDFETYPEYLAMLERRGVGPNIAAFIGHSSIRTWVMGDDAAERAATDAEIAAMADIVRDGMRNGALGFSTSTFEGHNGENGVPMPSQLADERELRALTRAMGESGRGIFMLTKGSRTDIAFLESLAADSGRPVMVAALLHNNIQPKRVFEELANIGAARQRGREVYGQVSCCPLTMEFTLKSPYLMESLPGWKPAMAAHDPEALKRVYADPSFRAGVKDDLDNPGGKVRVFNGDWDKITVVETANPASRGAEGRSVAALAREAGKHPLDWFLDFGLEENLETMFTSLLLNSDEEAVGRMLNDRNTSIALSDAGAHLTFFCDAGFGLHLLGHWVRDVGALSLEQAVHELTRAPADIYRIADRGRIAPGAWADMILFDPATIGRKPSRRVFDLPAGAPRLTADPVGLHGVWVNGHRVADETGVIAGDDRPGRVIRDFAA